MGATFTMHSSSLQSTMVSLHQGLGKNIFGTCLRFFCGSGSVLVAVVGFVLYLLPRLLQSGS